MSENDRLLPVPLRPAHPNLFRVIIHRNDELSQDVLEGLLKKHFRMSNEGALQACMKLEMTGKADCGVYSHDVAMTRAMAFDKDLPDLIESVHFDFDRADGPAFR